MNENISYILYVTHLIVLVVGIYLGTRIVNFFANEISLKIALVFDEEFRKVQLFYQKMQKDIENKVKSDLNDIEIYRSLISEVHMSIFSITETMKELEIVYERNAELHNEVIKLKKIISRLRKKNEY